MTDKKPRPVRPTRIVKPKGLRSFELVPEPAKKEPIRKTMMLIGPVDEVVAVELQEHQGKVMALLSGILDKGNSSLAGEGRLFQLSVPEDDLAAISTKLAKSNSKGEVPELKVRVRPG